MTTTTEALRILDAETLEALGYGSADELVNKAEQGAFPQPLDAGYGEPIWLAVDVAVWVLMHAKPKGARSPQRANP